MKTLRLDLDGLEVTTFVVDAQQATTFNVANDTFDPQPVQPIDSCYRTCTVDCLTF
jgi:hypothetical protein